MSGAIKVIVFIKQYDELTKNIKELEQALDILEDDSDTLPYAIIKDELNEHKRALTSLFNKNVYQDIPF